MKMPKNRKEYHRVRKACNLMILDQGKSGASLILPRKLCTSAPKNRKISIRTSQADTHAIKLRSAKWYSPHLAYERDVQLSKRWQHFDICPCFFPCFSNSPFSSRFPNLHVTSWKSPEHTGSKRNDKRTNGEQWTYRRYRESETQLRSRKVQFFYPLTRSFPYWIY